jgi:hypothetical protein
MPKGQSESVYRRRTDNTMAKRKSTKGQTDALVQQPKIKVQLYIFFLKKNQIDKNFKEQN